MSRLLLDLAITPEVFGPVGYSAQDRCDPSLLQLYPILLEESVVRNLAGGRWQESILAHPEQCSLVGQKLITALAKQSRLRDAETVQDENPQSADEWYYEALASHRREPSNGILVGYEIDQREGDSFVCAAESVHRASWFQNRVCSVRLKRQMLDYQRQVDPLLRFAGSAVFIDPYLDPTWDRYAGFPNLLGSCCRRETDLFVSIHTSARRRDGLNQSLWNERICRERFAPLSQWLARSGAKARVEVLGWGRMHDRYLITNLLGLSVPYGFDTDPSDESWTCWSRLSRKDSDDVLREFEPNNPCHEFKFKIELNR